jgi:hypothetical protein
MLGFLSWRLLHRRSTGYRAALVGLILLSLVTSGLVTGSLAPASSALAPPIAHPLPIADGPAGNAGAAVPSSGSVLTQPTLAGPRTAMHVGGNNSTGGYRVRFNESGLANGTHWGVTIDGVAHNSSNPTIDIHLPNGTYGYSIAVGQANLSYRSFTVAGKGDLIRVAFFTVTFTESGLPNATRWSVMLDQQLLNSTSNQIVYQLINGTYPYHARAALGYGPAIPFANLTVTGGPANATILFSIHNYSAAFTESGLPAGDGWYLNITGGPSLSATGATTTLSANLTNGTYRFRVATPDKFYAPTYTSNFTVNGAPASVNVTFSLMTYTVTFTEYGLRSGQVWSVDLSGGPSPSAINGTTTLYTYLSNGTYGFTVASVPGHMVSPSVGNVTVKGSDVAQPIEFLPDAFPITFTESGLPTGTIWTVGVNGTLHQSNTSVITVNEPNGSYTFVVGSEAGYTIDPSTGPITMAGHSISRTIVFLPTLSTPTVAVNGTGPARFLGLPGVEGYALLGAIIVVGIGVILAVVLSRRRPKAPAAIVPFEPPAEPPAKP